MADIKISALTDLNAAPAADDKLVIVDNSVSQTKRVDIADLFTNPNVTGTLTADGLTVDGGATFNQGSGDSINIFRSTDYATLKIGANATDHFYLQEFGSNDLYLARVNSSVGAYSAKFASNGDISFYEDTGTSAKFFWDASAESLGIGTSSPSSIFHAVGSGGANSTLRISNTSTLGGNWGVSAGIPALGNSGFSIYDFDNSSARLHIDSSGNVGIGTTSPSGGAVAGKVIHVESSGETASVRVDRSDASIAGSLSLVSASSANTIFSTGTKDLAIYTNSTERMRIDNSGRVGIGTDSPQSPLQVRASTDNSTETLASFSEASGNAFGGIEIGLTSGSGYVNVEATGGATNVHIDSNGASYFNGGNVGIGASSPYAKVEIAAGADGKFAIGSASGAANLGLEIIGVVDTLPTNQVRGFIGTANSSQGTAGDLLLAPRSSAPCSIRFLSGTSNSERMRIDNSGNLLVGTTSSTLYNGTSGTGFSYRAGNELTVARSGASVATFVRQSDDGDILSFKKDGTTVGSIGASSGDLVIGTGVAGVRFNDSGPSVEPRAANGNGNDGGIDLGLSGSRFRNLYLSGGIINPNGDLSITQQGASNDLILSSDRSIRIFNSSSEAARFDSSGNLLVGKSASSFTTDGIEAKADGQLWVTDTSGSPLFLSRKTTDGAIATFCKEAATVGSISVTSSATAYNTSSDYRLKEDIQPMVGASDRLMALNPVNFAWKSDGTRVDGFLAHEAQEVVPESVTGAKDAMRTEEYEVTPAVLDDEGNVIEEAVMGTREVPDYQGIDQSKLVPLLTAALQEALTEIESLKARVSALETN